MNVIFYQILLIRLRRKQLLTLYGNELNPSETLNTSTSYQKRNQSQEKKKKTVDRNYMKMNLNRQKL